jgi:hypothetical protein
VRLQVLVQQSESSISFESISSNSSSSESSSSGIEVNIFITMDPFPTSTNITEEYRGDGSDFTDPLNQSLYYEINFEDTTSVQNKPSSNNNPVIIGKSSGGASLTAGQVAIIPDKTISYVVLYRTNETNWNQSGSYSTKVEIRSGDAIGSGSIIWASNTFNFGTKLNEEVNFSAGE